MKYILFLLVLAAFACSKDDGPEFTSPEGNWTYTTPDGKVAVTFQVIKAGSNFDITGQTIRINGTAYNAEKEVISFTATSVQKIRINANDAAAVYPYDIVFNAGTVSPDFKTITVASGTYIFPWGTSNSLTNVVITRE